MVCPSRWFICLLGCGSFHFVPCFPFGWGGGWFVYHCQGFITFEAQCMHLIDQNITWIHVAIAWDVPYESSLKTSHNQKNNMKTFGFMLFTLIWNSKDNHHLLMYYCEINCHNNWSKVLLTTFLFLSSSSLPFCYFFSFSSMKTQSHKFVFIMNHKVVPWLSKLSTSCFGFYLVLHMNWSSICFFIKKLFPKLQALNYYFKLI